MKPIISSNSKLLYCDIVVVYFYSADFLVPKRAKVPSITQIFFFIKAKPSKNDGLSCMVNFVY